MAKCCSHIALELIIMFRMNRMPSFIFVNKDVDIKNIIRKLLIIFIGIENSIIELN